MANTSYQIDRLYRQTVQRLSESIEEWTAFLDCAGYNFKLRFDEQVLLYAQHPDATAVLTIQQWNHGFHRWVNRGAKGIAVFDDVDIERQKIRYYFDISDTHAGKNAKEIPVWHYDNAYQKAVIESLEAEFGIEPEEASLQEAVLLAVETATEAYFSDYLSKLMEMKQGSKLSILDEENLKTCLCEAARDSSAYMILRRLGVDTETVLKRETLSLARDFNTKETMQILGTMVSDISQMALYAISKTIRTLQKENRTFESESKAFYTKRKEKGGIENETGNPVPNAGRLSNSEHHNAAAAGDPAGKIRTDAPELSERTSQTGILSSFDRLQASEAFGGNRQTGRVDERTTNRADDESRGHKREIEGGKYDALGAAGEQHTSPGDRNRESGADLQIAYHDRKTEVARLPFFNGDEVIHEILLHTPHLKVSREEIRKFFTLHQDMDERILYLKEIFNNEYTELFLPDGRKVGYKTYQNVLHLWEGSYLSRSAEGYYDWGVICEHFDSLRLLGKLYDQNMRLPSCEEQQSFFENFIGESEEKPFFTQEIIDEVLTQGSGIENGKFRIYEQLEKGLSQEENVRFLIKEYGIGGKAPVKSGLGVDEEHSTKGIKLSAGFSDNSPKLLLTWKEAEKRIRKLISMNRYLNTKEAEQYPAWLSEKEAGKENRISEEKRMPVQYHITDANFGEGTPKEKFRKNLAALRLLKQLESEDRLAREKEQEVLAGYCGWGGLSDAFDDTKADWHNEYEQLKTVLTEEEYKAARASTLTSFYTPPVVIQTIYQVLMQAGLTAGNLLEPSCGIGNFFGVMPEEMKDCKTYGVEIDPISARIAKQLYQKTHIVNAGFENTNLPDSFFDAAVGNVPFGDFSLPDKRYDKENFLIHDYFFAKTLDKVRPGGLIAFVTSKGTLDKENPSVRKYLAQRAELVGAIRMPYTTFQKNAGAKVTTDILFLKKRERMTDIMPSWVHLGKNEEGITINQYFLEHPDMVLGKMEMRNGRFRPLSVCVPDTEIPLSRQLFAAAAKLKTEVSLPQRESPEEREYLPADPNVRNFSYAQIDGRIYYREDSVMREVTTSDAAERRIRGMIAIRDTLRRLIQAQEEDYGEEEIQRLQRELNQRYDRFTKENGLLSSKGNRIAFSDDSSYVLLTALETLNEDGSLKKKADIFTKRTIRSRRQITHADTAVEALGISIGERGHVDMKYMESLCQKNETEIAEELSGIIFRNPKWQEKNGEEKYLPADAYLSGNVREKLSFVRLCAELEPEIFTQNVKALESVQPKDLTASEISVKLGAIWIPESDITQFMFELLGTPAYLQDRICVHFSKHTGEWRVQNKSYDSRNLKAYRTYGTERINAYKIIEQTLNLKEARVFDYIEEDGVKKAVLNQKETAVAQEKQMQIKQAFTDWIWKEPDRRNRLCKLYNDRFNAIRPREYDGSHILFHGMNTEITLMQHQKNAVARVLYGGNALLAHCVGAGKTFEMTAAAMESRRLGLCSKPMFVVPNHLINQWASEFLQLYPAANLLVATKKDFERKNRRRFCSRIATGEYDAIIIGHSQFEKIPISTERQEALLEQEIEDVTHGIQELKRQGGERLSIKALEKMKRGLETKLKKLSDQSKKDDVMTFEELGVDRLFIDEAHYYKNLFLYTKMRNVSGISQTEAQKSTDLYLKCRYLDELTGGRGVIFATGTPVSNSMTELYTLQRYLSYDSLKKMGLEAFDAWASTFGETVTAIELSPEGTGYRAKTRFAKFYNLPELMAMFKEIADIKTADMLKLPVPEAEFINISVKPSQLQKEMVLGLSERADRIRGKEVSSDIDNMLKVTNDGRKLALEQRLLNPMLPDFEGSKVNRCVEKVYEIWEREQEKRLTQLIFCDLSTPKNDGSYDVYHDIKEKLMKKGVPETEIRFIHEADTEAKKAELFSKVREGQVRILLGSTQKMGAGTNVQQKLTALHDLDCPWRPSDLEQRSGRIIRQGNTNEKVQIFRYVTEGTFDAYLYQLVESKQRFISQIYTSKAPVRSAEDVDEAALSYAEIKMLASGNPYIKEKMDLDIQVSRLKVLKQSFLSERYDMEDRLLRTYPQQERRLTEMIKGYQSDLARLKTMPVSEEKFTKMQICDKTYVEKKQAGAALLIACKNMRQAESTEIGEYKGFKLFLSFDSYERQHVLELRAGMQYAVALGEDSLGNLTRIENTIEKIPEKLADTQRKLQEVRVQIENAKAEVKKEFPREAELFEKSQRLQELDALLRLDQQECPEIIGEVEEVREREKIKETDIASR